MNKLIACITSTENYETCQSILICSEPRLRYNHEENFEHTVYEYVSETPIAIRSGRPERRFRISRLWHLRALRSRDSGVSGYARFVIIIMRIYISREDNFVCRWVRALCCGERRRAHSRSPRASWRGSVLLLTVHNCWTITPTLKYRLCGKSFYNADGGTSNFLLDSTIILSVRVIFKLTHKYSARDLFDYFITELINRIHTHVSLFPPFRYYFILHFKNGDFWIQQKSSARMRVEINTLFFSPKIYYEMHYARTLVIIFAQWKLHIHASSIRVFTFVIWHLQPFFIKFSPRANSGRLPK